MRHTLTLPTALQCIFSAANYDVVEGGVAQLSVILQGTPSVDVEKSISCTSGSATGNWSMSIWINALKSPLLPNGTYIETPLYIPHSS